MKKMNRTLQLVASTLLIFLLCGCDLLAGYGGKLSEPEEAHIDLSDETLSKFNDELSLILFRYLAGNPRWEIREERGLRYAVRLKQVNGKFKTTLNGYYSTHKDGAVHQTRVLISFGREYRFGRDRGNITRTKTGEKDVPVIIEGEHAGTPGNSSYTIIAGDTIFLEIYDQAPKIARVFTQQVYKDVSSELKDVIEHRALIENSGILPVPERYPEPLPQKREFIIKDGMQPGIYLVTAAVGPSEPGSAFVKAFNVKTGAQLSQERMTPRSTRYLGWSEGGKTLFSYGSDVTVYEGDWSSTYEARFELWHRSNDGIEQKLVEKTRMINGWQQ